MASPASDQRMAEAGGVGTLLEMAADEGMYAAGAEAARTRGPRSAGGVGAVARWLIDDEGQVSVEHLSGRTEFSKREDILVELAEKGFLGWGGSVLAGWEGAAR